MLPFPTVLFALTVLFSVITTFENGLALTYVSATQDGRSESSHTTRDRFNLAQIRSSHEAVMDALKSYTDDDITNDPTVFKNVTEYELLQAPSSEGIDSSEYVLEAHSDTKYEEGGIDACNTNTAYLYYKAPVFTVRKYGSTNIEDSVIASRGGPGRTVKRILRTIEHILSIAEHILRTIER